MNKVLKDYGLRKLGVAKLQIIHKDSGGLKFIGDCINSGRSGIIFSSKGLKINIILL